jgi:hypothetical protein
MDPKRSLYSFIFRAAAAFRQISIEPPFSPSSYALFSRNACRACMARYQVTLQEWQAQMEYWRALNAQRN